MEIKAFLEKLEKLSFSLVKENDKLILKTNGLNHAVVDEEISDFIRNNKQALMEYVSGSDEYLFNKRHKNISAIYRLSGLQEGMLFHRLFEAKGEAYTEQLSCTLRGLHPEA